MPTPRPLAEQAAQDPAPAWRMTRIGISRQQARAGICTAITAIGGEKSIKQLQIRDAGKRHRCAPMLQIANRSREMRHRVARRAL